MHAHGLRLGPWLTCGTVEGGASLLVLLICCHVGAHGTWRSLP